MSAVENGQDVLKAPCIFRYFPEGETRSVTDITYDKVTGMCTEAVRIIQVARCSRSKQICARSAEEISCMSASAYVNLLEKIKTTS